jgi:hypothetical protein
MASEVGSSSTKKRKAAHCDPFSILTFMPVAVLVGQYWRLIYDPDSYYCAMPYNLRGRAILAIDDGRICIIW